MLPRIFLILMQIGASLYFGPKLMGFATFIPSGSVLSFFVLALVYALLVWLAGHVGGVVLKDVKSPSPTTLSFTVIGALIGAVIATFLPIVPAYIAKFTGLSIAPLYLPLIGSIIGYFLRR